MLIPVVEPAAPTSPTAPVGPPARLDHLDTTKIRRAAHAVTHLYPGAAGKLLAQMLMDYSDFGYRVSQTALPAQLVAEVLAQLPEQR